MAEAVLSVVLERLAAIAEEKIRGEVSLVRGVKKEVLKLADKLKTIRNVLEDAERRGVKDKSVRGWLKKLEYTAYEMDDILDEWNYYAIDASLKRKEKEKVCCSFRPSSCLCFKKVAVRRDIAMKMQNVNTSLDEILKEKDQFNFVTTMPTTDSTPQSKSTTPWIDVEKVQSEDVNKNKDDIVRKLMMDGDQEILSIVGMGGIGKTTLAQLVYNDSRVKGCFDLTIWVCVSDPFDVARIASEIIEKVEGSPPNTKTLPLLLEKLGNCISGKKFLLVLDDVWIEDYDNNWEPLMVNLKCGAASSKILVTTRKEGVAQMMGISDDRIYRPQLLKNDECWSLLRRISFRGKEERGEFEEVGKELANKCKGLPLAVNILGSVLQFKNSLEEWKNVSKSEIWQMGNTEKLFPHLLLSYNELSPTLKLCFSYCAVYPKDTDIKVESLIRHWIAMGYLGHVIGNPRAEFDGRDHFNNLARRSLFQDFEKDDFTDEVSYCKMHDIVHDFAQSLRKTDREEAYGVTKRTCGACNNVLVSHVQAYRTLLWDRQSPQSAFCDCLGSLRVFEYRHYESSYWEKLIHLRWLELDVWETRLSKKEMKTICKLYYLQTLSLASCYLKEIPHELGNLVCLRHLNLGGNGAVKELPDNMFNLIELQTLLLDRCSLEVIPHKIGNLVNLRQIDLSWNEGLKVLPVSMCSLVNLHKLLLSWCSLKEIPREIENLVELRHLDLSCNNELEVFPGSITKLIRLHTLLLSRCSLKEIPHEIENLVELRHLDLSFNIKLEELPGNITKLIKLHTLLLHRCSLKEIPHEIGSLVKLRHLDISDNEELKELPKSMYKLVELQTLSMQGCGNCRLPEGLANLNGIRSLDWFYGGSGFNRFGLLKKLNTGDLYLSISVSSNSSKELVEDAREAELKKKIHLSRLIMQFKFTNERNDEGDCSSSSLWVDLIEALEPHQNLQFLTIREYMGSRLPHWISSPLNLIREIYLDGCSKLSSLPPMGKLPFLEILELTGMKELKVLGVEWLGIRGREGEVAMDIPSSSSSSLVAFPRLKQLELMGCPKWSEWEDILAEEEESSAVSVMPRLKHLDLCGCYGLNMLPHRLLRKASSLQSLDIRLSPALIQCYGDKDGSPWRSISQNNPQLQLRVR